MWYNNTNAAAFNNSALPYNCACIPFFIGGASDPEMYKDVNDMPMYVKGVIVVALMGAITMLITIQAPLAAYVNTLIVSRDAFITYGPVMLI